MILFQMKKTITTQKLKIQIEKAIFDFVPSYFRILEWLTVIGIFQTLAIATNHWVLKSTTILSYLLLACYISAKLNSIKLKGKIIWQLLALVLTATLATIINFLIIELLSQFK